MVNDVGKQIKFKKIKMAIAKHAYDLLSRNIVSIYENSRHNKGGSMTVPKPLAQELGAFSKKRFDDLDNDEREPYINFANNVIGSIKIILGL